MIDEIKSRLSILEPIKLEITDDSHHHAGHVGNNGGGHFSIVISSNFFEYKSSLERHRMVYDPLKDLIPNKIHALQIKTETP